MSKSAEVVTRLRAPVPKEQVFTAEISRVDDEGHVYVRVGSGDTAELRVLMLTSAGPADAVVPGAIAVLLRNDGDAERPIMVGVVVDRLPAASVATAASPEATDARSDARTYEVNGRKIHLSGDEEVRLSCGRSTLTLTRDGRVIIRGARIVTRASETNRIKGGTVQIN